MEMPGTLQVYEWKGRKFLLDEEWTGCLDAGWDYEIVKETMMQLKCKVNDDQLLKFNDKEEQNGHKCTCMISIDILAEVSGASFTTVILLLQPLQSTDALTSCCFLLYCLVLPGSMILEIL